MASFYTSVGQGKIADYIDDTTAPGTHYIGSGTGAGAASVASTVLSTESETRVSVTKSQPAADTNRWRATITYTGPKTVTNVGVFDASTSGNLLLIADGLSIPVDNTDTVEYTFDLQQKDATE